MAAFSSGVEWSNMVKPILSASYGSFSKNDVTDLVQSIIQRYLISFLNLNVLLNIMSP